VLPVMVEMLGPLHKLEMGQKLPMRKVSIFVVINIGWKF
jgi:hypothetical protein